MTPRPARSAPRLPLGLLLPALVLCAAAPAPAMADMRCDGRVVQTGDRPFEVQRRCGAPDFVDGWDAYLLYGHPAAAHVEEWYYNFGPSRLIHVLRFRNGRLASIETGGYGYGRGPRSCDPHDISTGLSQFELVLRCGDPAARERRIEFRVLDPRDRHSYPVAVRVDEWTYNFGPNQFLRHVTLVDGRVHLIELGDRGY